MSNIEIVILAIIGLVGFYNLYVMYSDYKWHQKPMGNFPFTYRGKEFWYSRSIAIVGAVFCKDKDNEWCVLANKRGDGTPDYQGYWNLCCGYLDFHETTREGISREVLEETGVYVPSDNFELYGIEDSPKANRQNVSFRYVSFLEGTCDEYVLTDKESEKNEVDEIKWIKVTNINDYNWAFNHSVLIDNIIKSKKLI